MLQILFPLDSSNINLQQRRASILYNMHGKSIDERVLTLLPVLKRIVPTYYGRLWAMPCKILFRTLQCFSWVFLEKANVFVQASYYWTSQWPSNMIEPQGLRPSVPCIVPSLVLVLALANFFRHTTIETPGFPAPMDSLQRQDESSFLDY